MTTPTRNYVDPAAFTQLFDAPIVNHAQICEGLNLIAGGVAARFWFNDSNDRDDIKGGAVLHAVERIDRFENDGFNNAFSYYSRVIFNYIIKQMKRRGQANNKPKTFGDVGIPERTVASGRVTKRKLRAIYRIADCREVRERREHLLEGATPYAKAI